MARQVQSSGAALPRGMVRREMLGKLGVPQVLESYDYVDNFE
jgi:hypothetical protein